MYHTLTPKTSPLKISIAVNETRVNKEWITQPKKGYHDAFISDVIAWADGTVSTLENGHGFCCNLTGENVRRSKNNFQSIQIFCLDHDNPTKRKNLIDWWASDSFIAANAYAIHHTSSSTPEHERIRIMFVLPELLYDYDLAQRIYDALHFKFPFTDKGSVVQVWSGAKGKDGRLLLNPLHWDVIEKSLFLPLDNYKAQQYTILNYKLPDDQKSRELEGSFDDHVKRKLEDAFSQVAQSNEGNRHKKILRCGLICGSLKKSDWSNDQLFNDIENRLFRAASSHDRDHKNDKGIRTFRDGFNKANPRGQPPDSERVSSPRVTNFTGMKPIIYSRTKQTLLDLMAQRSEFLTIKDWIRETGLSETSIKNHLKVFEKNGHISKRLQDNRYRKSPTNPFLYGYTIT